MDTNDMACLYLYIICLCSITTYKWSFYPWYGVYVRFMRAQVIFVKRRKFFFFIPSSTLPGIICKIISTAKRAHRPRIQTISDKLSVDRQVALKDFRLVSVELLLSRVVRVAKWVFFRYRYLAYFICKRNEALWVCMDQARSYLRLYTRVFIMFYFHFTILPLHIVCVCVCLQ